MSSKPDSRLRIVTDGSHLRKLVSVWLSTVPVLETCAAKASQEPAEDAGVCDSSIPHVATICTPQEFLARTYDLQEHLAEDKANTDGNRTAFLLDPSRSWIFWQLVHGANERTWVKCHSLLPPSSSHARGQKAQEGGDDIQAVWRWAGVSAEVNRDTKNRDLFCRAVAPDTIEDGKRVRTNVERVLETQEMQDEVKSAFVLATSSLFASGKKGSGTKEWFPLAEKMYKDLQQAAGRRTLLGKWVDCLTGNIAWEYGSQAEWVEHLTSRSFDNPFVENPEFDDCLKSLGTADDIHTWASEHPSIVFSVSSKPDQDRLRVLNVASPHGVSDLTKMLRLSPLLGTVVDGHCFSPETSVGGRCGLTVEGVRVLRNALDSLPDWDRMIGCPQRESSEAKLDSLSWVYGTEEDWKNWVKRRNLKARWAFPKAPNFETLVSDHGTQGGGVDPGSQTKRSPQYTWSRRQHDVIFIIRESGEQREFECRAWRPMSDGTCCYSTCRQPFTGDEVPLEKILPDLIEWSFTFGKGRQGPGWITPEQSDFLQKARAHPPVKSLMFRPRRGSGARRGSTSCMVAATGSESCTNLDDPLKWATASEEQQFSGHQRNGSSTASTRHDSVVSPIAQRAERLGQNDSVPSYRS